MLKASVKKLFLILLLSLNFGFVQALSAKPLKIYASIKPIEGIVKALIKNTDIIVNSIIPEGMSPHHFVLTPGLISKMNHADLLIWVGPQLEFSLKRYFKKDTENQLELMQSPDLEKYAIRNIIHYELNDKKDHDHENELLDGHIWLGAENVKQIANYIAQKLSLLSIENKKTIDHNLKDLYLQMDQIDKINRDLFLGIQAHYFVMHDAYQYFEKPYGLKPDGVIHIVPNQKPSAKHLREIVNQAKKYHEVCFFSEPQFENKLNQVFKNYPSFKIGTLDPLGKTIKMSDNFIAELLLSLARQYHKCFNKLELQE